MFLGGSPPLESGERRVVALHAHPWVLVRSALPLPLLALSPLLYMTLDVALPSLRLSVVFTYYLWTLAIVFALYLLKWIAVDLLPWSQRLWMLTDRRVIAQSGVLAIHRRECSLLKVQESDYVSSGVMARLFDFGDVEVETLGGLGAIIMREVGHPQRLQTLINAQARALREDVTRRRLAEAPDEVLRQLEAVVTGVPTPHTALTQVVRPVSPRAAKAQRRLNLLPDEAVVAVARQHPIVLSAGLLPPGVAALCVLVAAVIIGPIGTPFVLALLAAIGAWAAWRTVTYFEHEYVLTTERLMELRSTPFVFQMRDIVQLAGVQDVALEIPSLFGRLADVGDIVVEIAGPAERVVLKTVGGPSELQKLIFETIDNRARMQSEHDDQRLVSTLSRWFQEYHKLNQGGP